jgi:recombinational DNA repair protein (RecF pathway)
MDFITNRRLRSTHCRCGKDRNTIDPKTGDYPKFVGMVCRKCFINSDQYIKNNIKNDLNISLLQLTSINNLQEVIDIKRLILQIERNE